MDDSELRSQLECHHADSYGWAVACCSQNRELAEDILQTAYLKILQGRARYRGEAAFKTCQTAIMTHGGMGYAKEYHVERYLREALIARIAPVSPQMILNFIAEKVLGLPKSY